MDANGSRKACGSGPEVRLFAGKDTELGRVVINTTDLTPAVGLSLYKLKKEREDRNALKSQRSRNAPMNTDPSYTVTMSHNFILNEDVMKNGLCEENVQDAIVAEIYCLCGMTPIVELVYNVRIAQRIREPWRVMVSLLERDYGEAILETNRKRPLDLAAERKDEPPSKAKSLRNYKTKLTPQRNTGSPLNVVQEEVCPQTPVVVQPVLSESSVVLEEYDSFAEQYNSLRGKKGISQKRRTAARPLVQPSNQRQITSFIPPKISATLLHVDTSNPSTDIMLGKQISQYKARCAVERAKSQSQGDSTEKAATDFSELCPTSFAHDFLSSLRTPEKTPAKNKLKEEKSDLMHELFGGEISLSPSRASETTLSSSFRQPTDDLGRCDLMEQALSEASLTPSKMRAYVMQQQSSATLPDDVRTSMVEMMNQDTRASQFTMVGGDEFKVPMLPSKMALVSTESKPEPVRVSKLQAPIMLLTGHEDEIFTARFSSDGTCLASAGFDQKAPIMLLTGHEDEIFTARFSSDGTCLASAGLDQKIFLWNVYGECENFSVLRGHTGAVMDVHFNTDSSLLITAATDKTVRVWDMETGACRRKFKSHIDIVNACHPSRRGPQLVCSAGDDGLVKVYDVRHKDAVKTYENRFQQLAVTFNDTTDEIFVGSIDSDIYCWDMRRDDISYIMHGHKDIITGLSLSPNGNHVLSNSMDCSAKMWDIRPFAPSERCIKSFYGHQHNFEKNLLKCGWSGDGRRVTAGSSDRFVYVWDVSSRHILYKLPGHLGSVNATDLHPLEPILMLYTTKGRVYVSLSTCIYKNLAFEEYLLKNHQWSDGDQVMLLWSNNPAVIIGRHQNPWLEANIPFLQKHCISLARRYSGGGTVYHDRGNLNISLLTTRQSHNRSKNLRLISEAINKRFAVQVVPNKRDDLEMQPGSRKCSGTAARIIRDRAYHHLTLLVNVDLTVLSASLQSPFKDFITTNATRSIRASALGFLHQDDPSIDMHCIRNTLIEHFASQFEVCLINEVDVDEEMQKNEEMCEDFANITDWKWIYGKTPRFWFENGSVKQYVEGGIIKKCTLGHIGNRFQI
ncbi:lipoyltransferase and lipoate-protein ligase [Dictyocaulus viviparus]|uniref:Lipoyltransferase and lipoate-protein ligase n=1 Tax=Dictyocaulus viviparus TaxID=29172 RepID=A0A0D8XKB2_DICVI|nr:lipoyltransferase and lipoate-protein ligase [Dictyocaulus viviparus]